MSSQSIGLGVYVHIPFCATRCDYCAFATWTEKEDLIDDYVEACIIGIQRAQKSGELFSAETVFIGGGTPSLIGAERLTKLLHVVPVEVDGEVTVECNPESIDIDMLLALKDAGVTRISLGVQSVHQHVLAGLGRKGDPETSYAAIEAIGKAGFATFNVDLIYGGAGESDEDFANTLHQILSFSPPHVSAYALTVERGTSLSLDTKRHPDDDVLADRYAICDELLSSAGLTWYEVSNWAKQGHECRHNVNCWQQANYVAIGCAAHGHRDGYRYRNLATPELYIDAMRKGASTIAGDEQITGDAKLRESLELSLRTSDGVPTASLADDSALEGLVERVGDRAILTRNGRLLLNEVALRLQIPTAVKAR